MSMKLKELQEKKAAIEAKLASLKKEPSEEEVLAAEVAKLEQEAAVAEVTAQAESELGAGNFATISHPDGVLVLRKLPGSQYRRFLDLEKATSKDILELLQTAAWGMKPNEVAALVDKYPAILMVGSEALGVLGGASRVKFEGKFGAS